MNNVNTWNGIGISSSDELGIGLKKNPKKPNRQIRKLTKPKPIQVSSESSSNQSSKSSPKNSDCESTETEKPRKRLIRKLVKPGSINESSRESSETQEEKVVSLTAAKETLKSAKEQLQLLLDLKEGSGTLNYKNSSEQTSPSSNRTMASPSPSINRSANHKDVCQNFHERLQISANVPAQRPSEISTEQSEDEPKEKVKVPRSHRVAMLFERLKAFKAEKLNTADSLTNSQSETSSQSPTKQNNSLSSSLLSFATAGPPSSAESPTKPTSPIPTTKPTSPISTTKPTSPIPTIKPTSLIPTTKPTSPIPTTKPISPVQQPRQRKSTAATKPPPPSCNLQFRTLKPEVRRNIDFNLDSVTFSKNKNLDHTKCFNCGRNDHTYKHCKEPSIGLFCIECGWENVSRIRCPSCKHKIVKPARFIPPPSPNTSIEAELDGGDVVWGF